MVVPLSPAVYIKSRLREEPDSICHKMWWKQMWSKSTPIWSCSTRLLPQALLKPVHDPSHRAMLCVVPQEMQWARKRPFLLPRVISSLRVICFFIIKHYHLDYIFSFIQGGALWFLSLSESTQWCILPTYICKTPCSRELDGHPGYSSLYRKIKIPVT